MVQFGRRDANARGHSRKIPVATINDARAWKSDALWYESEGRYNLEIPKGGPPKIYDRKAGRILPPGMMADTGFIVPELKIDHVARLRFTVKTLVGVGWKFFRTDLLAAVDMDLLRTVLTADFQITAEGREGGLTFSDPFLVMPEQRETHLLTKIEPVVVRKGQTTILIREVENALEWSVACLGYLVGTVSVPVKAPLIGGDVRPRGGIRLIIGRDQLKPELVPPIG